MRRHKIVSGYFDYLRDDENGHLVDYENVVKVVEKLISKIQRLESALQRHDPSFQKSSDAENSVDYWMNLPYG